MLALSHIKALKISRDEFTAPYGRNVWELKGFVEAGTTYESHQFWVVFHGNRWETKARPAATLYVEHGGGVERIDVRHMFARQLRDSFTLDSHNERAAFFTCWGIFELARDAFAEGERTSRLYLLRAYAKGWLKKRKIPKKNGSWVWVEDPARMAGGKFLGHKHQIDHDY